MNGLNITRYNPLNVNSNFNREYIGISMQNEFNTYAKNNNLK